MFAVGVGVFACDRSADITFPGIVAIKTLAVDSVGSQVLERGTRDTLTATAKDSAGKVVAVPVVWRSSNEKVAVFERGGALVAVDTGTTTVTATSLGVTSTPVPFRVVWLGPARITAGAWTRGNAVGPRATLADSLRVIVTNIYGARVPNASVAFSVSDGGGSVSSATTTTGPTGIAAVRWTMGPSAGRNSVTASVVRPDGTLDPLVADNLVTFSLNSYDALTIESGDGQSAQILSSLAVAPAVKLVDSLGAPRAGIPVVFTAFSNGRVTTPVVSTDANGVATPGTWTLGDIPGAQLLRARVEDAIIDVSATGTGTPIHYLPADLAAGGFSTCARTNAGTVQCWGQTPQNGTGANQNTATPTDVQGGLVASALDGGPTHFCALTGSATVWCWGTYALTDTSGQTTDAAVPTELPSSISWAVVSAGYAHNCGISTSQAAYCWGANGNGQLGDGTQGSHSAPTPVTGGFQFTNVAAGTAHTCALSVAGSAFCWGDNQLGQLGDGTTTRRTSPTAVVGGHTFQAIGAGETMSCGLTTQGEVYCWGGLPNGVQPTPITSAGAPTFVSLTVGGAHACALTGDGTAWCWGANGYGQVGDSTTTTRATPVPVAGGLRYAQLSAGYFHTCGRETSGAVLCWGRNTAGELGQNTSAFQTTPRYIVLGVNP